jgi:hypothetical protein
MKNTLNYALVAVSLIILGSCHNTSESTLAPEYNGTYRLDAVYYEHFSDFLEVSSLHEMKIESGNIRYYIDGVEDTEFSAMCHEDLGADQWLMHVGDKDEIWTFSTPGP